MITARPGFFFAKTRDCRDSWCLILYVILYVFYDGIRINPVMKPVMGIVRIICKESNAVMQFVPPIFCDLLVL